MNQKKLTMAIPASIIVDTPHLREKTTKIGLVGRAAAIFRVDNIAIYSDNVKTNQSREIDLIAKLLTYMETPQYLRKRLFKLEPDLTFAGTLPPLRTPHHPLNRKSKNLKLGEYREGIVLSNTKEGAIVDIGVEIPAIIKDTQLPTSKRLTLKIQELGKRIEVHQSNRDEIPLYWGYTVSRGKHSFATFVENKEFDLMVATSKLGSKYVDVAQKLIADWKKAKSILLAFGAPTKGLHEIVKVEGRDLNSLMDYVVNTIPDQGTETVRTEEAIIASLALLNMQICSNP